MKTYEGQLSAKGKRFGIVVGRFNNFISKQLLEGALDCLKRHGAQEDDIEVVWVPGSFEIPVMAQQLARSQQFNSIICLGVLIRGHTPHFDYIAAEATKGIAQAALSSGVPTAYGIITADTLEQAIERGGTKAGNKGWDAALSGIEMADLFEQIAK
ncbi:6,7-dimethyl-8-ribityllumazine synthase [candidate division KSB1 bacterium]|nr:6,7-dimethyl-8-ribityllumazine synthase [candidate division KSB1 bacterium]NIR73350.1 6,7-dimethyl-8-ribityllumazine synthase [candidate division KSB1 bacterium]NIS25230.1 6,7-dimethyl-8-ribityllumazine synthase [candidate division KSB1 bacterium]NIT72133.1 6,7-dimethyl-8-ribityllumazine synthase [candidate division KSB1 bacterium]NIU25939.1 6,7-dimethyl-8-ribityllumazine synthase [candidate division KSB1 bacterium]